jgi:hypothetical protein
VAGGSTEVPVELGAHESALAATGASVEVAVMGSAAVCALVRLRWHLLNV